MKNDANRWIAAISLLSLFAIIACAGTRSTAARQTTQNVLVTNTSSQQVPVLPAARPGPGGAYIVAVNNAPSVKVLSSPTAPVVTKDSNNPDANGAIYTFSFLMQAMTLAQPTPLTTFSTSLSVVIDSIGVSGGAALAGECIDVGGLAVYTSTNDLLGTFSFIIPLEPGNSANSAYLGTVHIPVPAGGQIQVSSQRKAATSSCGVTVTLAYHTVPHP
jgi:hypothetical protein